MAKPNKSIYTPGDHDEYAEMMDITDAMRSKTNPSKPRSSRSYKYVEIIKPIWDKKFRGETSGKGVSTIILPSDPNALIEMLELRMSSWKAGNTGVLNEAVSICDDLLRQGVLDKFSYKALMTQLTN